MSLGFIGTIKLILGDRVLIGLSFTVGPGEFTLYQQKWAFLQFKRLLGKTNQQQRPEHL